MTSATIEHKPANGQVVLDEPLYEIINGEFREVEPMGVFAGSIANVLCFLLNQHAFPRRLGFAFVEVVFDLMPGKPNRRPDVAFVTKENLAKSPLPVGQDPAAWKVVPSIAVEVISPTNMAAAVEEKIVEYFNAGVELVWVIYPLQERIYVHESPSQARVLGINDELESGSVLPGFRLKIADLFGALRQEAHEPK